ncbi:MAG: cytochrome c biogenesis CcdA family protein [Acidimicrobiales bacterium]
MSAALLAVAAFAAGLISFSSPCCLPLIPGYLSYVSALPVGDLGRAQARMVTLRAALLFSAGFTAVFTALGVASGLLGGTLLRQLPTIVRVSGVGIIALGLVTLGVLRIPVLSRERRLDLVKVPRGPAWAFPLGMAFAAGWTPCIGPILATILATAAATSTAWWGGFLLIAYSAGLAVPFVALALGFTRATRSLAFLRRHGMAIERLGGTLLIVVGVAFVTGAWGHLFLGLQRDFARLGWPPV